MTRKEDLHTLGLTEEDDDAQDRQRRIRKAFLLLSRRHHPDKGGTKEGFQKLSEAYYRLREDTAQYKNESDGHEEHEERASANNQGPWEDYEYQNFWYSEFFSFFRQYYYSYEDQYYEGGGHNEDEDEFYNWEQSAYERSKAWSEIHKQKLKAGVDFRDRKAQKVSGACVFCGVNKPIKEKKAKQNGVAWEQYLRSARSRPGREELLNTCWVCKSKHKSVMTESIAKTKFAKKLHDSTIFLELRRAGCTFTAQPQTNLYENTRISEYFWYPDLECAALKEGWKPRGKMKDCVPWQPTNRGTHTASTTTIISAATVTPGSSVKRTKRRRSEDDDRKPSAKRSIKF